VDRAEHERREQFDRDVETLNKTLGEAVQKAALRAEKLEEASLVKLREEAMERLDRFQSALEQKFSEYQENAKNRVGEIHQLITGCREEWMQEHRDLEEKQLEYRGSWQRDIEAMDALAVSQHEQWKAAAAKTEERIAHLGDELSDRACEAERKILKAAEERLAEYGEIQERQWERISGAADDAAKLEAQLRLLMENAQEQVRCDFALYEEEQKQERERGTEEVRGAIDDIKNDVAGVEQELNELKNRAYENVSEKLRVFEDEFFDDIARRHEDIETRLGEWKANLDAGLDDARSEAENNFKAEAGRYNLALAETMKQNQRETETRLGAFSAQIDEWGNRFRSAQEQMRQEQEDWQARYASQLRDNEDALEDWKTRYQGQIREAEENLEETRRKTRELAGDADARIAALKGQVEEVRQGVRDFTAQTRLFEKADELKISLERGMEDLKAELDGIDQRRAEAAQLEAEFVKIRRLEDEVNSKMTRFLTEKHHLEIMERDFTRLIETSQKVEERLRDVTNSDDTLQGIQVAIRKLGDSIADADEKFLRLEKKNQVLDETRSSIDRNFSVLEETETILARCGQDITRSQNELDLLKPDIEALAAANKTAQEAQERLTRLDSDLANIEERMEKMQIAREWLAQTETRFTDINRQTREQFKLMEALLKDEGRSSKNERNTPTIAMRENVIKLARQGWERDKIAAGLKLSRGEVDLILEMGQRN
jgi:chromosome segregation ATPase